MSDAVVTKVLLGPAPRKHPRAVNATHPLHRVDLENLLGHRIHDISIYQEAFVHKSMHKAMGMSCERLELLGDAVLSLVVCDMLLQRFPNSTEGFITRVRVKLVAGKQLCKFAKALELNRWLVLSNNARTMHVEQNDRILEDIFESFLGALYKDMGFEACRTFISRIIQENVNIDQLVMEDNFKDVLCRHAQQGNLGIVDYELEDVNGPAHKRVFTTVVKVKGKVKGRGVAASKKASEMLAAQEALKEMQVVTNATIVGAH